MTKHSTLPHLAFCLGICAAMFFVFWFTLYLSQVDVNGFYLGDHTVIGTLLVHGFILVASGCTFIAGMLAKQKPRMASWWYLLGGLLVVALAVMFILEDTQALPSLLVPTVMLLMGWLLRKL